MLKHDIDLMIDQDMSYCAPPLLQRNDHISRNKTLYVMQFNYKLGFHEIKSTFKF